MRGRLVVALAILASLLLAAACADRTTSGDDAGDDAAVDAAPAGGEGDWGELEAVCGPNEGGGSVPSGDSSETQGVGDGTLTVGTIADPGFEGRPGLNQEIFDTATGFVEWCNAAGGINGRQLELNLHDAAVTGYQAVVGEACTTDFAIVGDGAVQDNLWFETGAACGLIDIAGFSVNPERAGVAGEDLVAARSVQPVPNAIDRFAVGPYLLFAEEQPEVVERTGIVYGDLATMVTQKDRTVDALEQIGYDVVSEVSYNILGEANWAPIAQTLVRDDVRFLHFIGEPENLALLLVAMADLDYRPDVVLELTNFYDPSFIEAAGDAAEGVIVQSVFAPFEEPDEYPAMAQYLDVVAAVDGKTASLGVQAMSSWLLFAQAAKACDLEDDLTRTCVLEEASSTTEWTGGGLHEATDPSSNEPLECYVLLEVQDGAFVRYSPDEGYDCGEDSDASYVVDVEP